MSRSRKVEATILAEAKRELARLERHLPKMPKDMEELGKRPAILTLIDKETGTHPDLDRFVGREPYRTGRDALSPAEVTRLLMAARSFQDEVLFRLAIETGVRRDDLIQIRVEGLSLATGEVTYFETKKNRTRTATVGSETVEVLRRYVATLPKGSRWLFPGREQGPHRPRQQSHLSGKTAWNALQWALKRAGLRRRPFHALRATCVKLAQRRGWTPEQVSEQTGDTIRVIQQHYSTPSRDEMRAVTRDKPLLGGGGA